MPNLALSLANARHGAKFSTKYSIMPNFGIWSRVLINDWSTFMYLIKNNILFKKVSSYQEVIMTNSSLIYYWLASTTFIDFCN